MSGLVRKHVSKRDSKEDTHLHRSNVNASSGPYYRNKESEPVQVNADSNSGRRSAADDDQYPGEVGTRSRVSQNNDDIYYSEQDNIRQQFPHRSGSRSNSRSRSRSRSPIYIVRRNAGTYDRNKTRTLVSPTPIRELNNRSSDHQFDRSSDYGWEDDTRKPRETKDHNDGFREVAMMKSVRSLPEDNSRRERLHDGVLDPRLRRHRSEFTGEKETERRDCVGEGEYHRSSNIPCMFFAAGFCRNGKYCRFSHRGAGRKQPQDNSFYRQDSNNHSGHNKWNDVERLDKGRVGAIEVSRTSKEISESKGNGGRCIDGMEMSPDWNYGVQSLKNPVKKEPNNSIIVQSSQSRVLKDNSVTSYDQTKAMSAHCDKTMAEKTIAASHQSYSNPVNVAPVQAFNENHNVMPYQSSLTAASADFSVRWNFSNLESGKVNQDNHLTTVEKPVLVQNTGSREQIDQITKISASIAQILATGIPIPQLKQALQMPVHSKSVSVQPNQATTPLHTQGTSMSSNTNQLVGLRMSTGAAGVPAVTASQVSNFDGIQDLMRTPKGYEENGNKKTDEASKEEEGRKTGGDTKDAENIVDEDDDEENKKGKDPKEMRAFKFALVEVVKELLNPAWKEGKMTKDEYKNIVKKAVEKVTITLQSGNVPQTEEKIDHYLSASKPKLSKLVQAYISKIKTT